MANGHKVVSGLEVVSVLRVASVRAVVSARRRANVPAAVNELKLASVGETGKRISRANGQAIDKVLTVGDGRGAASNRRAEIDLVTGDVPPNATFKTSCHCRVSDLRPDPTDPLAVESGDRASSVLVTAMREIWPARTAILGTGTRSIGPISMIVGRTSETVMWETQST